MTFRLRSLLAITGFLLSLTAGLAAYSHAQKSPEIAAVTKAHIATAIELERALKKHYDVLAPDGQPWFEVKSGYAKILVTAGHATAQTREGVRKFADGGTGSLALMLNHLANAPTIYTTYRSPSDPNFYDDNDFKREIERLIKELKPTLVIDLHASASSRPYDVDFGTMHGKSLLDQPGLLKQLATMLEREGVKMQSDNFFAAEQNATITKWVSSKGAPCIQLEINAKWLAPDTDEEHAQRFAKLLQGLARFIEATKS